MIKNTSEDYSKTSYSKLGKGLIPTYNPQNSFENLAASRLRSLIYTPLYLYRIQSYRLGARTRDEIIRWAVCLALLVILHKKFRKL